MTRKPRKSDFRELKSHENYPKVHTPGPSPLPLRSLRRSVRKSVTIYPESAPAFISFRIVHRWTTLELVGGDYKLD